MRFPPLGPEPSASANSATSARPGAEGRLFVPPGDGSGKEVRRPDEFRDGRRNHPRARFQYEILDTFEAGLVLLGSEVKALREGKAQLPEAYAKFRGEELFLLKCHIPEYRCGAYANHEPTRPRKLLLHAHELAKIRARVAQKGLTLVPLALYFNEQGRAKLEIALARGRKIYDKREALRSREARENVRRASRR